jgi:tight adherence protein C
LSPASALAAIAGAAGFLGFAVLCAELFARISRLTRGDSGGTRRGARRGAAAVLRRLGLLLASAPPIRGLSPPGDLEARLVAAGEPAGLGLRDWVALKAACALLAGMGAGLVGTVAPPRIAAFLVVTAPALGFVGPDICLARLSRRRLEAAARELPDMLALLRVAVEAGMPPARALGVVGAEFQGTMAREWRRVAAEVALGLAQDRALDGLRARLPADEVASLVESLARARRHGVPLGRALDLQAARAREHRRRQIREQAARAGPKIQLVVALLLVPAVLLIVAAGLIAELQRSGLFVGF